MLLISDHNHLSLEKLSVPKRISHFSKVSQNPAAGADRLFACLMKPEIL
jgi:hypothetical protein